MSAEEEVDARARPVTPEKRTSTRARGRGSRAPGFVQRSRTLHLTWRAVVFFLGFAIVAAGVAMLVLPGPGWAAIFVGLAVLATEFVWAQRMLGWTRRQASKAAERALNPQVRRRNLSLCVLFSVVFVAVVAGYLYYYGSPAVVPTWLADLLPRQGR